MGRPLIISDNPFAKREEFSNTNLIAYKILTIVTWLAVIISGAYYTFARPTNCSHDERCHTIWGQNNHRPTPFALNSVITSIYWTVILILQANYVRYLYHIDTNYKTSAANVGSHFILVSRHGARLRCSTILTVAAQHLDFWVHLVMGTRTILVG